MVFELFFTTGVKPGGGMALAIVATQNKMKKFEICCSRQSVYWYLFWPPNSCAGGLVSDSQIQ